MSDFRVSYRIDSAEAERTVSGQILQMRMSRCYTESESMTCATCHNPHATPKESEKLAHFRNKCLSCHQTESCGIPATTRLLKEPDDNCVVCHMPRGPTDIPHLSFTHHRIGIHQPGSGKVKPSASERLIPVSDVSHLPEIEQQRLLGLAHQVYAGKLEGGLNDELRNDPDLPRIAKVFDDRGREILQNVRAAGLRDAKVEMAFSRMHWRSDPQLCIAHAKTALQGDHVSPSIRRDALFRMASSFFDQRQYKTAMPYLEELVKLERSEISLMLLAICHQKQGDVPTALRLIQEAIDASPDRADLQSFLASIYQQMNEPEKARQHMQRAQLLNRLVPQPQ